MKTRMGLLINGLTELVKHWILNWIEYIPKELLSKIKDKSITHNIFSIQDVDSIMCGFYHFRRIYDCRKNFVRL